MAIYEKRTYDIAVGKMNEVAAFYRDTGWPALESGGYADNLLGYFISETGPLHQLIHIWRFEDDTTRRAFWNRLFADEAFMAEVAVLRQNILRQEVQLMASAPWGPTP